MPDKDTENISQIINDFSAWGRRIKLKVHFGEQYQPENEEQQEQ